MFLLAHRWIRGLVLACMVFLAGAAACSSDSYDPDPYDDVPPVVTVEFNYVVPSQLNIRRPQNQNKHQFSLFLGTKLWHLPSAPATGLRESEFGSPLLHGSPQWVIPLRR
jgi:hypothetical protein